MNHLASQNDYGLRTTRDERRSDEFHPALRRWPCQCVVPGTVDEPYMKCYDTRMLITMGKVLGGTIKIDGQTLPEGAVVTVLAPEGDETFELAPEEETKLLAAIAEAERGETASAPDILQQIRRS